MIKYDLTDAGFHFTAINNQDIIPFSDWADTDDRIYYFPLSMLVDNGCASVIDDECVVPFDCIYLLEEQDRKLIGLPSPFDKYIRLSADGMLNTPDIVYCLELLTSVPDGDVIPYKRLGNVVFCENSKFLLSNDQFALFERVEVFNALPKEEKITPLNMRCFGEIKALAQASGCELDSYLNNENVFVPDRIGICVGEEDGALVLSPTIDIPEGQKFTSTFVKSKRVLDVYPVSNEDGERIRVVISNEQKEGLETIKANNGRFSSKEEIKKLIESPTETFDPDQFDLSEFYSDRVIKIGVYKPKFYPFVCPYKSAWIVGAKVESPENGTTKVTIPNEETLKSLEKRIQEAKSKGSTIVEYEGCTMGIEDAEDLASNARKHLDNPKIPLSELDFGRKVLIIEENAEELGFDVTENKVSQGSLYTLYKDDYLSSKFTLKSHQEEGIAWLQYLYLNKAGGCLLADDMGLGKTLQILYFIDWHARTYPKHKPYLIIAPIALLENWENEYDRFFRLPKLSVNRLSSKEVPRKFDKQVVDDMQKMDLILTNYESLRISQLNFCAVDFDIVVLDEAQKIKSPGTLVTNAAKALKSTFKVAMTGTPVENSLLDLWSIMDFCVPGLLGNAKAFAVKYQKPLKNPDIDLVELGNRVHQELGVYFMRRMKQDVAKDLPEKIEQKKPLKMPMIQETMYEDVMNRYTSGEEAQMLKTILAIREVSEHPYLHDATLFDHSPYELIENSARLHTTMSILDDIKDKAEKVIVFAERKDIQRMLQNVIWERYGVKAKIINGDSPTSAGKKPDKETRQRSIDEFQRMLGFNVIIMSPIAAGMGLNVTAANHVIHYSRHWNPAKESQATDRAYRIGQQKDVYVYYPMAVSDHFNAFDVTLDDLLSRKTALATSTIFPTERVEVTPNELGKALFGKE